MRKLIKHVALVSVIYLTPAFAVQAPASSLQQLQDSEKKAVKHIELISGLLASKSISHQRRNRLEQELVEAQTELSSIRQSIAISKEVSGNEMVIYTKE